MLTIFHFEIEEAAEKFKGTPTFNNWKKFGVDKKLGLKL